VNSIANRAWLWSLSSVAACCFLVWSVADARSADNGYAFSNISVTQNDEDHAKVTYDYGWATSEFPGWRLCTWTVYGADGAEVGSVSNQIIGLDSSYVGKEKIVSVSGSPSSANVSCAPGRLGSDGEYAFSDVRAIQRGNDPQGVTVLFNTAWRGSGVPGPVSCHITVRDRAGNVIAEHDTDLLVGEGDARNVNLGWRAAEPLSARPATADLECVPFG
jgi:hypothetical protein